MFPDLPVFSDTIPRGFRNASPKMKLRPPYRVEVNESAVRAFGGQDMTVHLQCHVG